jgi:hypothetical protein
MEKKLSESGLMPILRDGSKELYKKFFWGCNLLCFQRQVYT